MNKKFVANCIVVAVVFFIWGTFTVKIAPLAFKIVDPQNDMDSALAFCVGGTLAFCASILCTVVLGLFVVLLYWLFLRIFCRRE